MARGLENAATATMLIATVAVAAAVIHREFGAGGGRGDSAAVATAPTYIKDWEKLSSVGQWIGDSNAPVRIVEFADFECPFCRRFEQNYRAIRDTLGNQVALLYVQLPLSIHRFAKPAAYASECARQQSRFAAFHDALFAKQDSFGLKTWTSFAAEAGVPDTVEFSRCVVSTKFAVIVDSAMAAASRLGLHSTPVVLINGFRYSPPPYAALDTIVRTDLGGGGPKRTSSR